MAVIRETFVLEDRFSAVFASYLDLGRQIAANMRAASDTQDSFTAAVAESGAALEELSGAGSRTAQAMERSNAAAEKMAGSSGGAASKQERLNRAMRSGSSAADGLTRKLMGLAAAYVGVQSAQKLLSLTDTWTQTTARLDRMNDGAQATPEIQDMIFHAAQRSRGDYQDTADMAAKLGTLAPEAFGSTAEVVAFTEQINKQFALAGTSAQGAQAAMLQLTQAMASGVLRGEELNSVLEQAPTITQAIAKYMGVTIGELRELASEGQVTANVVKAALFAAAEETNAAFEAVPLTFSQAWTLAKNEMLNAFRPALEELSGLLNSDLGQEALNGIVYAARMAGSALTWLIGLVRTGAEAVRENWELVSTILQFAGGAILALTAISVASSMARAGAWAMEHWQMLAFVAVIGAVITAMYAMGMTSEEVFAYIGAGAGWLFALGSNLIADGWNLIATFAEFFANVFDNPVAAIANLFLGLFNFIMDVVGTAAGAIDALLGSDISGAVRGFQAGVNDFVTGIFGENQVKVERMEKVSYVDTMDRWSNAGAGLGKALDSFNAQDLLSNMGGAPFDYDALLSNAGITGSLEDIGADTKAIRNSVSLSEEDMKLLVDQAERRYVTNVNLTSQTPIINISGQNSGDSSLDRRALADAIRDILIEQSAAHTDLSYT